jgi:L-asparaginase II
MYTGMTVDSNPLGFALKIDDGSRRAAEVAMGWLISRFCNVNAEMADKLKPWFQPEVKTVANMSAGVILPSIQ